MRIRNFWLGLLVFLAGPLALRAATTMEVYEIVWTEGMDQQTLHAAWDGTTLRIEQPDQRFALLYREKTDDFIGMEMRDAADWKFNWTDLAETMKRQQASSRNLRQNLLTGDNSVNLLGNANAPSHEEPPTAVTWQPKAGSSSVWSGTGSPRGVVEAQADGTFPGLGDFWPRYAKAADVVRTVAVREMAPSDLLPLISTLPNGTRNISTLRWYRNGEMAETVKVSGHLEPLDPARFVVPTSYRETKLTTLEGVFDDSPAPDKHQPGG